jgi:hypothetical protein
MKLAGHEAGGAPKGTGAMAAISSEYRMLEETADGENGFQAANTVLVSSTVSRRRYRPKAIGRHDDFNDL